MIAENLAGVRRRIDEAALRAGRDPSEVTLVAVSKSVDPGAIAEAANAGVTCFGENYVQEALRKQQDERIRHAHLDWHFIGHLQRNKVRDVVGRFALFHSVDSISLAEAIGERAVRSGHEAPILLQVRLDPDERKFGLGMADVPGAASEVGQIPGVRLMGLMGMAPFSSDAEQTRGHFRALRAAFGRLPDNLRHILSMGMSGDFEIAIEEGSTHVRIGTALFGSRLKA